MLDKDTFKNGIDKLLVEYGDRGFTMTRNKSQQWYEHMKNLCDQEFEKKIHLCLLTCKKVPFMADVLDAKDLSEESKEKPYWLNAES